jgi:hypothetical protein
MQEAATEGLSSVEEQASFWISHYKLVSKKNECLYLKSYYIETVQYGPYRAFLNSVS